LALKAVVDKTTSLKSLALFMLGLGGPDCGEIFILLAAETKKHAPRRLRHGDSVRLQSK